MEQIEHDPAPLHLLQQAQRLQMLNEIGRVVSSNLDLGMLYETIYRQISRVMDTSQFFLAFIRPDRDVLHIAYHRENGDLGQSEDIPFGGNVTSLIIDKSASYRFDNAFEFEQFEHTHGLKSITIGDEEEANSMIFVPLNTGNRTIGAMSVQCKHLNAYSDDDVQTLSVIASQAAVAIENARLYSQNQSLLDVAKAVSASLDLERVFDAILAGVGQVIPYQFAAILVPDHENRCLREARRVISGSRQESTSVTIPFGTGVTGTVFQSGEPSVVPDVNLSSDYVRGNVPNIGAELAVPLKRGNTVVGVLNVERQRINSFSQADMDILAVFASHAAAAIENAQLFRDQKNEITQREQAQKDLLKSQIRFRHQALHDVLTGLPNRSLLQDRLERVLLSAERSAEEASLLLMDLDGFKEVNDTFGHHYGDALLQEIGRRLHSTLRRSDTVARLGGDEFAIVLPGTGMIEATRVAEAVHAALVEPFELEGHHIHIGASIGIAVYPFHGDSPGILLRHADVAMYVAKRNRTRHAVYTSEQDKHSPGRLALSVDLQRAIERDELILHYQPKLHLGSGRGHSIEALVRWQHPTRGLVPPVDFIALAENTGLIHALTLSVVRSALQSACLWSSREVSLQVAVNLSAQNLMTPGLARTIAGMLDEFEIHGTALEVEITESILMSDPEQALQTLTSLHDLGIRICVDDFGTGYSSLAYLKRLPVDELKIDRSFVTHINQDPSDLLIVRSVIDLGHSMGMEVTGEGVEDEETLKTLAELDCDLAQGYYIARPMPAASVPAWYGLSDAVHAAS